MRSKREGSAETAGRRVRRWVENGDGSLATPISIEGWVRSIIFISFMRNPQPDIRGTEHGGAALGHATRRNAEKRDREIGFAPLSFFLSLSPNRSRKAGNTVWAEREIGFVLSSFFSSERPNRPLGTGNEVKAGTKARRHKGTKRGIFARKSRIFSTRENAEADLPPYQLNRTCAARAFGLRKRINWRRIKVGNEKGEIMAPGRIRLQPGPPGPWRTFRLIN